MKPFSILLVWALFTSALAAHEPTSPSAKGLRVHEWGVFRVHDDAEFANADLRALWDDLPEFAYGNIRGRTVPVHFGAFEIRKNPIIFFHAADPVRVRVKLDFPGGMPGVWFPATESPAAFGLEKLPKVGSSLEWLVGIKNCPEGWRPKQPAIPTVAADHWINRIRKVKADEVFARYSPNPLDVEREKFIYYDGIFPQTRWLKVRVQKDRIALTNPLKHAVYDVTVVDRRGDRVRVGRLDRFDAGAEKEVMPTEADAARFVAEASATLLKQLAGAGLHEDEAQSLIDMWKKELFEVPGVTLFYRLPQERYDACLPLIVTPKPDSVVRVGLIYHCHLEPDFAERILELVKQLDAPKFADRDAAMKKLSATGPAALVQLQRLSERKDLSAEVQQSLQKLIKKWSVRDALDQ